MKKSIFFVGVIAATFLTTNHCPKVSAQSETKQEQIVIKMDSEKIKKLEESCSSKNLNSTSAINFLGGILLSVGIGGVLGFAVNSFVDDSNKAFAILVPLALASLPITIYGMAGYNYSQAWIQNQCGMIRYEMPANPNK